MKAGRFEIEPVTFFVDMEKEPIGRSRSMTGVDLYRILGVRQDASSAEIKTAYRRLARELHPDLNPESRQASEDFQRVQDAYRILGRSDSRRAYDRARSAPAGDTRGWQRSSGHGSRAGDKGHSASRQNGWVRTLTHFFHSILPGSAGFQNRRRGTGGPEAWLEISFSESIRGTHSEILYSRKYYCSHCRGSGGWRLVPVTCRSCKGTGRIRRRYGLTAFKSPCPKCDGKGKRRTGSCRHCLGEGYQKKEERLVLMVPPGIEDGQRIRIRGKGDVPPEGRPPANLTVRVRVKSHAFFQRLGRDVFCEVPVTVAEAALGAEIDIPTVYGKARLKIPPGIRQGQRFRLKGRGVAGTGEKPAGDQIVELEIVLPQTLNEESRRLLRELERQNPANPRAWMLK